MWQHSTGRMYVSRLNPWKLFLVTTATVEFSFFKGNRIKTYIWNIRNKLCYFVKLNFFHSLKVFKCYRDSRFRIISRWIPRVFLRISLLHLVQNLINSVLVWIKSIIKLKNSLLMCYYWLQKIYIMLFLAPTVFFRGPSQITKSMKFTLNLK